MNTYKILALILMIIVMLTGIFGCSNISKEQYQTLASENVSLMDELDKITAEYTSVLEMNKYLADQLCKARTRIGEFAELEEKYLDLSESEIASQIAANELQAEKDRIAKEELMSK